jgi:hypothetical protein
MSIPNQYNDLTGTREVLEDAMLGNALNGSRIKSISLYKGNQKNLLTANKAA